MGVGVPKGLALAGKCDTCEVSKHAHQSFPRQAEHRATAPFELVHTDVVSVEQESLGGARYAVLFTDELTRWRHIYFMSAKSETLACLQRFQKDVSGLLRGMRIQHFRIWGLRSDNGGEYTGHDIQAYCQAQGIHQTFCGPHAPQQNGIAERSWRTVMEMARCLIEEAGLGKEFWGEAANTAVYLMNRLPTGVLGGSTPYHALFGRQASLEHLRVFGCRAYAQFYDTERKKMDPKAWRGILVGYDDSNTRCYRVYDPEREATMRTVHVTFNEALLPGKLRVTFSDELEEEQQQQQAGA
jgi:hypothetical protein